MSIRFFYMFAGIGGFRSGLEAVGGFECIGHCEIDRYANQAYNAIYEPKGEYYCADARQIEPDKMPDFDIICAGDFQQFGSAELLQRLQRCGKATRICRYARHSHL